MNAVVYGGNGALGRAIVTFFRSKNWTVTSIDFKANDDASQSIVLTSGDAMETVHKKVAAVLGEERKLDAIVNVAGGWAGGNAASDDIFKNTELMFDQSVKSSVITARLAATHLKEGGSLTLTGAAAATGATPSMIAYGIAKASVHHLIKSLSAAGSGMPANSTVHGVMLDTPMNRKFMPDADTSTWTPLPTIAEKLHEWISLPSAQRPTNGSLFKIVTKDNKTSFANE